MPGFILVMLIISEVRFTRFLFWVLLLVSWSPMQGFDQPVPLSGSHRDTVLTRHFTSGLDSLHSGNPVPFEQEHHNNWMIFLALAWLLFLVYLRYVHMHTLHTTWSGIASFNQANLQFRNIREGFSTGEFLLLVNYIAGNSLLGWMICRYFGIFETLADWQLILGWGVLLSSLNLLRGFMLQLLSYLFQSQEIIGLYSYHISLVRQAGGLLLLLLLIPLLIWPGGLEHILLLGGVFIFFSGVTFSYYRGLQLVQKESSVSLLQLFLYICTLEIAPFIVTVKGILLLSRQIP